MTQGMDAERARVRSLVVSQVDRIKDRGTREQLQECLAEPRPQTLQWAYGGGLETYQCWVVAGFAPSGSGIGYSEQGFGPRTPWGLIWLDREDCGQDCSWFTTLHEAYLDSFGWKPREIILDPTPWRNPDDVLNALFAVLEISNEAGQSVETLVEAIKRANGDQIGLPIEIYVLHTEDREPSVAKFLFHLFSTVIGALTCEGYSIRLIPNWVSDPTAI